ncbi:MAG: translocation protein TolB [Desulfovibrio sp.]|jgi:TolB protein|nr:translocation protein TolB [Desulfovibrio sp.]
MHRPSLGRALILLSLVLLPGIGKTAQAAPLMGYIEGAGKNTVSVVQTTPFGNAGRAAELQRAVSDNFSLLPFVEEINARGVPGGPSVEAPGGKGVNFERFVLAGVNLLITANWVDSANVEMRCFSAGEGRFLFGNRYAVPGGGEGIRDVADKFCANFLDAVIGNGAFFRSNLAFIRTAAPRKKDVWTMKPNGRFLRRATNLPGEALSPAWSPDGRFVVFTHIDARTHALGVWDSTTRTVQRITFPGNTVIGPAFMPDNRLAVSLTDGANPSIFLLNHRFQKERRLDNSMAIDVSPSVDASGARMVFTSNRYGNPHIFLKDLRTGLVSRVTTAGRYNSDPSISPDGTVVAFARQEGGGHRIYTADLLTGQERQITFGPGSDEQPEFAPDGYFITFMSTRSGQKRIYVITRHGGTAKALPTGQGDASFPAWGPAPRSPRQGSS